jgi:hypothetical protein
MQVGRVTETVTVQAEVPRVNGRSARIEIAENVPWQLATRNSQLPTLKELSPCGDSS